MTRATSIERIKNTRMHASRRCRRHRSRQTRVRLDSIVPIRPAYLPSSADTIETRSIDRRGHDAARETRRRRATRGDAPGDGGGRELRGRGHGWRETSTSADDDDDDDGEDDEDEDEEEAGAAGGSTDGRTNVSTTSACGGGAVETIHVHPSLLGHAIRIRVHIHGMNIYKERETYISVTTAWRDRTVEMWHHTSTRARATTTNAG